MGNAPLHRANASSQCRAPTQPHPMSQQSLYHGRMPREAVNEDLILSQPHTGSSSAGC